MKFIKNLVCDGDGIPSLTDSLALVGFLSFIVGSGYLMYHGIKWDNYDKFADITGGGSGILKLGKIGLGKAGEIWGKGVEK